MQDLRHLFLSVSEKLIGYQDQHKNQKSCTNTGCQGNFCILDHIQAQKYADIHDSHSPCQKQCTPKICSYSLIYLKSFRLPVIKLASDHTSAVLTDHLLTGQFVSAFTKFR